MMADALTLDAHGVLTEPATLTIRRLLPGPIERCWAWLTESDLRRKWLAAGEMDLRPGASFELVWRNDMLTDPPGQRPAGFGAEHRMECRITELDPPRRLSFTWSGSGDVTFELLPEGGEVLLTVTHRRLPTRSMSLNVCAGWHAHLDMLAIRAAGGVAPPFWDHWAALKRDYEGRIPA